MTESAQPASSWAEQYVDRQVDVAWRALRADLADRFEAGLDGGMEPVEIRTADGRTLVADVCDDHLAVIAGDHMVVTSNVDEAAYKVVAILRDEWQVVHPLFLDTAVVEVPSIDDNPTGATVPHLGTAASREQLQAWVVATFQADREEPLRVSDNGDIPWRGRHGSNVVVRVRTEHWIEVWTVLAREVSFKRARREMAKLGHRYPGVSFHLDKDTLVMSRVIDASPFVPEHLEDALWAHIDLADQVKDVADRVLRNRVKVERAAVAEAEEAKAAAESALAEASARIAELEAARDLANRRGKAAARQRNAAEAELAALRDRLERMLGHSTFRPRRDGGAA